MNPITTKPDFVKWLLISFLICEFLAQKPRPELLAFVLTQIFAGLAGGRSEQALPLPPT